MLPEKPVFAASDPVADEPDENSSVNDTVDKSSKDIEGIGDGSDSDSDTGKHVDTDKKESSHPPLPAEEPPPLPDEKPPTEPEDDGWTAMWDDNAQAFFFYNRFTKASQWDNPRVPTSQQPPPPGTTSSTLPQPATATVPETKRVGGYDPAIHGDYDPNADYAKAYESEKQNQGEDATSSIDAASLYAATGAFNRFTGKWQASDIDPDRFSDENKSRRQMNAFFDVESAANNHDGRSLKAERSNKRLSKKELKDFKEKRREKKEEKRRAWLRD